MIRGLNQFYGFPCFPLLVISTAQFRLDFAELYCRHVGMRSETDQTPNCSSDDDSAYYRWSCNAGVGYKVVATYPHSTTSYSEGFFYSNGLFYEGTSLQGHSQVLVYEPKTGTVKQSANLPPQFFGEGIVDWASNLYEWTWQTNVGFVRDRATLKILRQFTYSGEAGA